MPLELPLLDQPARHGFSLRVLSPITDAPDLLPGREPRQGEQYRFHFNMAKCIGCKCCVVACNEQNGNPAELNWRRVGELEGGIYPDAQRWHMSAGCNHCLEPSCLIGCPVEAYSKDPKTGIVDHNPDICIGCQYCTWNCSYGVPQYNPERGVVGKCDMCHTRLEQDMAPACVNACPEEAIAIEIVNVRAWRQYHAAGDAPGLPSSFDSLSTTRVTLPSGMERAVEGLARVDRGRVHPQDPHWSLVALLVMTQLAVGALGTLWAMGVAGAALKPWAALIPIAITAFALAIAPLHLGRPALAHRALKNWRRSWLSREVLALSVFAQAAAVYAGAIAVHRPWAAEAGAVALVFGLIGVMCSARIYMVVARPAWNLPFTLPDFYLTCAVLGPWMVLAAGLGHGAWLIGFAIAASLLQCTNSVARLVTMWRSPVDELSGTAGLLRGELRRALIARFVCVALAIALVSVNPIAAFLFSLASETLGRYLFFAGVVPKSVASTFLTPKEAAA
jgi:Fe-S-cluster-containing dehydrogenase component/DMSO reductase anchor subunit